MAINGGNSVLKQVNDAVPFDRRVDAQSLHKKDMARKSGEEKIPGAKAENEHGVVRNLSPKEAKEASDRVMRVTEEHARKLGDI